MDITFGVFMYQKHTKELSEIKRHIRLYRQTGCWQTERKTNVRSTPALRRTVIDAIVKKSLSYAEVIAKYGISFTSLGTWETAQDE